jgi:mitochondrial chaperone BCS1
LNEGSYSIQLFKFYTLISRKVFLSVFLNVIDSVGSQENRVLIMTTNHIICLDEVLIRPSRVDKKVELGLANNKITADFFYFVFKPVQEDVPFPGNTQSGDNTEVHEATVSQTEAAERIKQLAKKFASNVPELKFSLAEIFLFLLEHRKSPEETINNIKKLISKLIKTKSKPLRISENTKPENTQLVFI